MLFIILSIALQVGCAVHAIRTGRAFWWLYVILIGSYIGCLVYFIVEVLPEFRTGGQRVASKLGKVIDPARDLKRHADDLAIANTVENKLKLAQECLRAGHHERALELYESCLAGVHKDDAKILLGVAEANFHLGRYAQVKDVLDRLIESSPNFKSPDGHMLYARALEELNETEAALDEYKVLAGYYSGIEAKCRYALLLRRCDRNDEARELFNEIVLSAKRFRQFYKGDDRHWIDVARDNLKQLES